MSRLIDADKLLEEFNDLEGSTHQLNWMLTEVIPDIINKQPTAYDMDKVVEELQKAIIPDERISYNEGLRKAIKIVKTGEINEQK